MNQLHRLTVITAVVLTMTAGVTSPARAAAPSNDRRPIRIERLTVTDAGTVDLADGDARLTLSRRCSRVTDRGGMFGMLQQRVGDTFVARGFVFRRATCGTSNSDMKLRFQPESDIAFGEGPATVFVRLRVCSPEPRTCTRRRITEEVVLAFG
jgi:hypothetical protein